MDPMKVHRVMELPTPMKVKEVQSFLGFVGFYLQLLQYHLSPLHTHLQNPVMGLGPN